jgi:hypothetical protein
VPGFLIAGRVLQGEGEDRAAFFDGVLAVGVGGEGTGDFVEGGAGGEGFWCGLDGDSIQYG